MQKRTVIKAPNRRKLLREFRNKTGLSLDELAKRCGLSKSMLSKFELGHRELSEKAFQRLTSEMTEILAGLKEGQPVSHKELRPSALDKKLEQLAEKAKFGKKQKEAEESFWWIAEKLEKHREAIIQILKTMQDTSPSGLRSVNFPNEVSHLSKWLIAEEAASHAYTIARTYTRIGNANDEAMRLLTQLLEPQQIVSSDEIPE